MHTIARDALRTLYATLSKTLLNETARGSLEGSSALDDSEVLFWGYPDQRVERLVSRKPQDDELYKDAHYLLNISEFEDGARPGTKKGLNGIAYHKVVDFNSPRFVLCSVCSLRLACLALVWDV